MSENPPSSEMPKNSENHCSASSNSARSPSRSPIEPPEEPQKLARPASSATPRPTLNLGHTGRPDPRKVAIATATPARRKGGKTLSGHRRCNQRCSRERRQDQLRRLSCPRAWPRQGVLSPDVRHPGIQRPPAHAHGTIGQTPVVPPQIILLPSLGERPVVTMKRALSPAHKLLPRRASDKPRRLSPVTSSPPSLVSTDDFEIGL